MFHRSIFIEIWGAKNCGFGRLALFILNGHYKSTHCYRPHPYFQTRPVPSNWYLSFSAVATIHSRISAGQACKPQSYAILNYTNRQIVVVDTSIAKKDFKVPCQVIFLNISLPVRQKLWAHRTISGNKISSFCCAARISLDSRFSFPLINIFNLAFYRNWFLKKNAVSSLFTFIPPTSPSPRLDLVRW